MRSPISSLALLILSLFAALIAGQAPSTTITTSSTITVTKTLVAAAKTVTMTLSNSTVAYPTYASTGLLPVSSAATTTTGGISAPSMSPITSAKPSGNAGSRSSSGSALLFVGAVVVGAMAL